MRLVDDVKNLPSHAPQAAWRAGRALNPADAERAERLECMGKRAAQIASMSHGRAQPRHRRRKSDFFGSPAKQSIDAPPVAAPEAADDEWVRCHDAATGASYYANRRSFEVSWTPPPAVAASAPAPPPVVVAAEASVAAPPPARARRAADAAWIGRGGAALAKATREAPTPVVAPPPPPVPEPPSPPSPPTPETPPTPEPDDEPSYEEFVVVDERTDSGTEGAAARPTRSSRSSRRWSRRRSPAPR